jgi:SAM-dependent methyltransferase
VLAVEPEPYLRERARREAASAPVAVRVLDGVADDLPLGDASVDVGVFSLVLCSVPSQSAALAELRRVLRPGGELRSYEHVRSDRPGFSRLQRAADLVWPHVADGCHTNPRHARRDRGRGLRDRGMPALLVPPVLGRGTGHPARDRPRAPRLSASRLSRRCRGRLPAAASPATRASPVVLL